MMRGVWVAYAVVSWCYFCVSISGYWAFGNSVMSNVIFSIGHPKWMVAMADLFVTVHVIGSYQVSPLCPRETKYVEQRLHLGSAL